MILSNLSEFRANIDTFLDKVENDNDILLLKRETGKGVVIISLEEYDSLIETAHLLRSPKNRERLREALDQIKSGDVVPMSDPEDQ